MKKVLVVLVLAAALTVVVVMSVTQASRRGTKVYEEEARRVDRIVSTVKATGEIQPRVYVNISSQVMGEIVELRAKEGDQVRRGDVLVQLDPRQYRSTVTRLEASQRMALINLERERVALGTYESTLRRQKRLAGDAIVSDEALEQAQLQRDTARIQVQSLEESIRQADADLVRARDELDKTTIRAPIDGLITRVNAKLGEQVIVGTMNNAGTVILVLSDMSELLAEVRVDETEVAGVRSGQRALVTVDAIEKRKYAGAVSEIAHTAVKERDVSRFTVKVVLSRQGGGSGPASAREVPIPAEAVPEGGPLAGLRPGMSAHAAIEVAVNEKAVVVPIQAVIGMTRKQLGKLLEKKDDGRSGGVAAEEAGDSGAGASENPPAADEEVDVLFVDRDGKAELLQVKTGLSDEFNVEILEATLQPGDRVVVGPYRTLKKLKPGDVLVRVEKDEELTKEEV